METYLLIENGVVINAIVWDGNTEEWEPPNGITAAPLPQGSSAWIGWSYDGQNFTAPAAPAPTPKS